LVSKNDQQIQMALQTLIFFSNKEPQKIIDFNLLPHLLAFSQQFEKIEIQVSLFFLLRIFFLNLAELRENSVQYCSWKFQAMQIHCGQRGNPAVSKDF